MAVSPEGEKVKLILRQRGQTVNEIREVISRAGLVN
jgi:predicted DNA-binding antitoxin AbrB/MazE fold protein